MEPKEILEDCEMRMDKAIEVLKKNLSGIRTGPVSYTHLDAADE